MMLAYLTAGKQKQEDREFNISFSYREFEATLGHMRPHFQTNKNKTKTKEPPMSLPKIYLSL